VEIIYLCQKKIMYKITPFILVFSIMLQFNCKIEAQNLDINILKPINQNPSEFLRSYSEIISNTTTVVALAPPAVIGIISLIEKDDEMFKTALNMGAAIAIDGIIVQSIKRTVRRPRPYSTYPEDIIGYQTLSSLSFPSGHTSLAFTTATSMSLNYPKWYVIVPSFLWAGSVGYSRMNLGVHYPSDVLAGALLGAGSAYLSYKVNKWYWKKKNNKKIIGLNNYF